jgi:hypothetical protein
MKGATNLLHFIPSILFFLHLTTFSKRLSLTTILIALPQPPLLPYTCHRPFPHFIRHHESTLTSLDTIKYDISYFKELISVQRLCKNRYFISLYGRRIFLTRLATLDFISFPIIGSKTTFRFIVHPTFNEQLHFHFTSLYILHSTPTKT